MKFILDLSDGNTLIMEVDVELSYAYEKFAFEIVDVVTDLKVGDSITIKRMD